MLRFTRSEATLTLLLLLIGVSMEIWGSHRALDVKFYYSANEARDFLRSMDAAEAAAYLRNEILDLGFLSTYSALSRSFMCRFYPSNRALHIWALVPGFFDLIETSAIIWLLLHPESNPPGWLGVTTCLKWLTGATVIATLGLSLIASSRKSRRQIFQR